MKQVMFLLAAAAFFYSCTNADQAVKCEPEQIKAKLLKQTGLDKMDKEFTFDYAVQNDSVVAMLSLVPDNDVINFNEADSAKGVLLNVFITPNGNQYSTRLKRRGGVFQVGIQVINGVEIPILAFVEPQLGGDGPGGNPPPDPCCTQACIWGCYNYFTYNVLPRLQKKADSLCRPVKYDYSCPFGAINPCMDVLAVVFPKSKDCGYSVYDPGRIAMQKFAGGIVIKNTGAGKEK